MSLFKIPDWESGPVGDKSAKEMLNTQISKKTKKQKFKKKAKTEKQFNEQKHNRINLKTKSIISSNSYNKTFKNKNNHIDKTSKQKVNNNNGNKAKKLSFIKNKITTSVTTNKAASEKQLNEQKRKKINLKTKNISSNIYNKTFKSKNKSNNLDKTSKHKEKNDNQDNAKKLSFVENKTTKSVTTIKDKIVQKLNKKKMARLKKQNKQMDNIKMQFKENKATAKNAGQKIESLNRNPDKNTNEINMTQTKKQKLISAFNLADAISNVRSKKKNNLSLRERMMQRLKASRFRYINEQIYNSEGKVAHNFFKTDPDAFNAYHNGYRQQIAKWPMNPLNIIIKSVKKMPKDYIIADFGCGDANLAKSVSQKVHSFDFVAINEHIMPCDMAHVPLEKESVNVVVFCLSLMGTNIKEYLYEANRVLKKGGKLKIAEVESRFDPVDAFIEGVTKFGFKMVWKDLSNNLFYFLDFEKISQCKPLKNLPTVGLHPCVYKKR